MMVIFLVGLVSMILMRTLRKDYARYSKEDDIDEMVSGHESSIYFWCQKTLVAALVALRSLILNLDL